MNGRNQAHWTLFGQQGFPAISVPAGFTKQVYDRVPDAASTDGTGTRLVGPVAARLPVGVDFAARPFGNRHCCGLPPPMKGSPNTGSSRRNFVVHSLPERSSRWLEGAGVNTRKRRRSEVACPVNRS